MAHEHDVLEASAQRISSIKIQFVPGLDYIVLLTLTNFSIHSQVAQFDSALVGLLLKKILIY